jgi:hypothetical protein
MRRPILSIALVTALVLIGTVSMVSAQSLPPSCGGEICSNATSISGEWVLPEGQSCAGFTMYAALQAPPVLDQIGWLKANNIGTGTIGAAPNHPWTVTLTKPLAEGERVYLYSDCVTGYTPGNPPQSGGATKVCDIPVVFCDFVIPEAGTLMMMGTGLAGLAGYVGLRFRARK